MANVRGPDDVVYRTKFNGKALRERRSLPLSHHVKGGLTGSGGAAFHHHQYMTREVQEGFGTLGRVS
jgi:hypothetical protein